MTVPFSGGCACGAVRYECAAEPLFVAHCHCRDCQKASGGQMSTVAGVPRNAFRLTAGKTRSFAYSGDSGKGLARYFCENCGSRLYTADLGAMPELMFVAAGSLDDASWLKPVMHIYTKSKQPWADIPANAVTHARMPG